MKLTKTKRKELKPGDMFCMPYEQPVSEVYMVLRDDLIDSLSNAEVLRIEPDDMENAEPEPKTEMITGYCRYCPKIFKYPNVYGLAQTIHAHEATCPERPKGDGITIDETDVPIVPQAQAEEPQQIENGTQVHPYRNGRWHGLHADIPTAREGAARFDEA